MTIKSMSIRIKQEMLDKLRFVAAYEGRSVNKQVLVCIREHILAYEKKHGQIQSGTKPDSSGKP